MENGTPFLGPLSDPLSNHNGNEAKYSKNNKNTFQEEANEVLTGPQVKNISGDSCEQYCYCNDQLSWFCEFFFPFANDIANPIMAVFAFFALRYAWKAWNSSEHGNVIAQGELDIARQNAIYEMQPYLSIEFDGATLAGISGTMGIVTFRIAVTNSGNTPAEMLFAEFEPDLSKIYFKCGQKSAVFKPKGKDRSFASYISSNSTEVMNFPGIWETKSEDWASEKQPPMIATDWICDGIALSGFAIRFKDFETRSTNWHKIAYCSVRESSRSGFGSTRTIGTGDEDDSSYEHYKDYKPVKPREVKTA